MVLDIHSHRMAPYPEGVISLNDLREPLSENQPYSCGIHPWNTASIDLEKAFAQLEETVSLPNVVAIGECGVDPNKGAPMFRQLLILKRHIELSERVRKPLILHCVKGSDIILGLKRDFSPAQPWIIHGFRGKPALARQLTDKGIYLSFGEKFNPDTVAAMPGDMILAETDDSAQSITEIIGSLSRAANRDLLDAIASNTARIIRF